MKKRIVEWVVDSYVAWRVSSLERIELSKTYKYTIYIDVCVCNFLYCSCLGTFVLLGFVLAIFVSFLKRERNRA